MCKSELYRQILGTVSQETEISEERILSKAKNAEIVDARYLLVYFLWRQGFHAPVISSLMNFSRRPIEKMISQFDLRRKQSGKMFEMLLVRIASKLRPTQHPDEQRQHAVQCPRLEDRCPDAGHQRPFLCPRDA